MRFFIVALAFVGLAAAACPELEQHPDYNCRCENDETWACEPSAGITFYDGTQKM
ncbi:hypothetical protein P280DRAFT_468377 [Massarina eburnea CBS 473.64]|uniref:Extracellular membrane protein CFEM domain-containing protein n=1 Tax=Massarina eburnea CBS 473.64 TaxID=1395130 RepID=A0A6A6S256_9PLEO|nr:hypothetical protein P280DRAFT_468377 [Massarina eburnea CBS 473.64]